MWREAFDPYTVEVVWLARHIRPWHVAMFLAGTIIVVFTAAWLIFATGQWTTDDPPAGPVPFTVPSDRIA